MYVCTAFYFFLRLSDLDYKIKQSLDNSDKLVHCVLLTGWNYQLYSSPVSTFPIISENDASWLTGHNVLKIGTAIVSLV